MPLYLLDGMLIHELLIKPIRSSKQTNKQINYQSKEESRQPWPGRTGTPLLQQPALLAIEGEWMKGLLSRTRSRTPRDHLLGASENQAALLTGALALDRSLVTKDCFLPNPH